MMSNAPRFRMVLAAFLFPIVLAGCSGTIIDKTDVEKGVYAAEDLDQFVEDTSTLAQGVLQEEYVIGVGDLLDVVFVYHSNLTTRTLFVRRDGRISLPYVGDAVAAGLTPMTLASMLTKEFSEILREPNLSVIVVQPAKQKVYVLGEVNAPGRFLFDDELSLVQSIAVAGGLLKSANAEHAILIRRQGINGIVGIEIDVKGIMVGALVQNDIRLRNYDIVFIPKRRLYSVADFMQVVDDIISPPLDTVFTGWQIRTLTANYEFFTAGTER